MRFTDADYPEHPYPGARPPFSYVHAEDGTGLRVDPDPSLPSRWRVGGADLDAWLLLRGAAPLAERTPVLSYGSNPCPAKLSWLRTAHGFPGPAVVLRAHCSDLSAVWAFGLRMVDDQRPAVLAAVPGAAETHAVIMATPEQVLALDSCEGRGDRHHLAEVPAGSVTTEDGGRWDTVLTYVGARLCRRPLLVDGAFVRCAEVSQEDSKLLFGTGSLTDGLAAEPVPLPPDPRDYPRRLFVYGTLQPDAVAWHLLEPSALAVTPARLPGTLYDTGLGYPALAMGGDSTVAGSVVTLRSGAVLAALDEYEGAEYARVRVVLAGGMVAWTYVWTGDVTGMRTLDGPWPLS